MPLVNPKRTPVDDAMLEALGKFVGPENPPVNALVKEMGEFTGPNNPPVNLLTELLRRGDPYNAMTLATPAMALWKTDEWGRRFKVSADTGKALEKTAKDIANEQAAHLAQVTKERRAEGLFRNVGFRNPRTGEVIEGSTNHPNSRDIIPNNWPGDYEDGFITPDGRFMNRHEAAKYAYEKEGYAGSYGPALESVEAANAGLFGDSLAEGVDETGRFRSVTSNVFKAGEQAAAAWAKKRSELAKQMGLPPEAEAVKLELIRIMKQMDPVQEAAGVAKPTLSLPAHQTPGRPVPISQIGPSDPAAQLAQGGPPYQAVPPTDSLVAVLKRIQAAAGQPNATPVQATQYVQPKKVEDALQRLIDILDGKTPLDKSQDAASLIDQLEAAAKDLSAAAPKKPRGKK